MKDHKENFLDPLTLAKLSDMRLRARFVVEGFISGLHQSKFKGSSVDFAEHREYVFGDEIKNIDWKVYGKFDRFYIKQYQEETSLKGYILVDSSASMKYGSTGISKFQYACYLASSLAYLMLIQQDEVGVATFSNEILKLIPARGGLEHIKAITGALETSECSGKVDIQKIFKELSVLIKKRSLIIFISDLFDDEEKILHTLKAFRFRKNEVIIFHLLDPAELDLPFKNTILFEGMESKEQVLANPNAIKEEYKKTINSFIENYRLNFRKNNIDYTLINTSTPLDKALGSYLYSREKL